jgi:hypothetical protein
VLKTTVTIGKDDGPFAVDTFGLPERNPWNAQLRLTGFDFLPGRQADGRLFVGRRRVARWRPGSTSRAG